MTIELNLIESNANHQFDYSIQKKHNAIFSKIVEIISSNCQILKILIIF